MNGNPMQACCGAHCRTTGLPCRNSPMPNGRCRMHGGKSTGPPIQHGYYSKAAAAERKLFTALLVSTGQLVKQLKDGPIH